MSFKKERYVEIFGLNICYRTEGCGLPIVLIHGFNEASDFFWDNLVAEFGSSYHIIGLDLPGFGLSEKPRQGYTLDKQASVVTSLIKLLNVDKPLLIGHSYGGLIAARIAVKRYITIAGVVLYDTPVTKGASRNRHLVAKMPMLAGTVGTLSLPIIGRWLFGLKSYRAVEQSLRYSGLIENPEEFLSPQYVKIVMQSTYDSFVKTVLDVSSHSNLLEDLKNITMPILAIYGENDPFINQHDIEEMILANSQIKVQVISNTAHVPLIETPDKFNTTLFQFLNQLFE